MLLIGFSSVWLCEIWVFYVSVRFDVGVWLIVSLFLGSGSSCWEFLLLCSLMNGVVVCLVVSWVCNLFGVD